MLVFSNCKYIKQSYYTFLSQRAYEKSLYDRGANIALISKALGHSDLAVTTHLDIEVDEVAENLRDFL